MDTIVLLFCGSWTQLYSYFRSLSHLGERISCSLLDDVPQNKKQKAGTGLLLDKLHKQDFAGPLACRASRVLGPISRHRVADILHHMTIVSRASRPGLLVGVLRILCTGICTAQRFHTEEHDHTCRIGCPDEPDPLTHCNECLMFYNVFLSFWRHAAILLRRNHILHDLITRVFMRSLQYGIVVLGFLDAFVYAHHKHRLDSANAGNFGDCMTGRVRFMSAITPPRVPGTVSCAAFYWHPAQKLSDFPRPSPGIRTFPMIVPLQMNVAMLIMDGLFIQMLVPASLMVKLLLDGV